MSKHTPGPWNVAETRLNYDTVIRGTKSEPIALVQISGYSKVEGSANSVLIAAAPDLLNALQNLLVRFQHRRPGVWGESTEPVIAARAAIAKATVEPA